MTAARWWDDARERATVEAVAVALGLEIRQKGRVRGFTCPIHGKDHSDGKPSGRLVHDGRGWRCWACDLGGSCVTLACYVLTGQRRPEREQWFEVRAWFASRGWCEPFEPGAVRPSRLAPVVQAPEPQQEPPPVRLDPAEVAALWEAGVTPITHAETMRWLRCRRWQAGASFVALVASQLGLARSLPASAPCPPWAGGERWAWASHGWSLIMPTWDADGRMAGMRARWVGTERVLGPVAMPPRGPVDVDDSATYLDMPPGRSWTRERPFRAIAAPFAAKEVSPSGGGCKGTVYACPVGRWLLRGRSGDIDPDSSVGWDGRILIVEGGPAFLTYATQPGRVRWVDGKPVTHAVLGVWSGSWPAGDLGRALALRCRVADTIAYAPDDDDGGDRIAAPVSASLAELGHTVTMLGGSNGQQ